MKPVIKIAIVVVCLGVAVGIYRAATILSARKAGTTNGSAAAAYPAARARAATGSGVAVVRIINPARCDFYSTRKARGRQEVLPPGVAGLPADAHPFRVHIKKAGSNNYDVAAYYPCAKNSFASSTLLHLHFKARSSSENVIAVQLQHSVAPQYLASFTQFIRLTPRWVSYDYTLRAGKFPPEEQSLMFKLGESKGVVDLAAISLLPAPGGSAGSAGAKTAAAR